GARAVNGKATVNPMTDWEGEPLTDAELADLRARLNAHRAEEGPLELTYPEEEGRYELGIVRYPRDVDRLAEQVRAESLDASPEASSREYAIGILDALAWARGEERDAPVTGTAPEALLPS